MKRPERRFVGGVLLFLLSGLLVACSDEPQEEGEGSGETNNSDSGGDDLVLTVVADAVDLDPHGSNDTSSAHIRTNLYDKLVEYDENMEIQPELADGYEQIDDHTWEFRLKEDVTFHDGEPFDAEDVVATLERVTDPEFASEKMFLYEMIETVEAIDDYTVQITTEYPFAPLPANLTHDGGGMMSAKAIEEEEDGGRNLNTEPVGTGPFKLENWAQGNEVILTQYDDYHEGPVSLDSATFQVVDEELTRISMVENNEAHVADNVEPEQAGQLESMEGADSSSTESWRMDYIGMNNNAEPFDDSEVRRAISMMIDKDTIIEGIYDGYGGQAIGPLNPLVFGYSEDIDPIEYDVEEAQSLMEDAGYEDGFEATLLVEDADQLNLQVAEVVQDQLQEINVDLSIEQQEWGSLLETTGAGEYEMVMLGWTTVTGDADNGLYPVFHSDNQGPSGNQTFYSNDEVDELLEAGRQVDEENEDERLEIYEEAQQIIIDDAPIVPIIYDDFRIGISDSVEGFIQLPSGLFDLRETEIVDEGVDQGGY
ncbi:glutathione ABC transporter substrate-binding protein [Salicibibacter cibi]|uniref:Glutathione ABC transporter substrate-binding protein n=1 Tax=Salicibibacter cibi TaxID=2743001 RepID=A0A7T6ZBH8_9BACI|nr:glutathione ABC transporter substrate-binding protein [Salicibibacter cibi]QQK80398.1 glutathione ABC transporter substrate-binding protein [Salicibibacter cibi]